MDPRFSDWKTIRTFLRLGTCSETLANVLDRAYDQPLKIEEHAAMPLAGGIGQHGYQCGLLWGATLAAGARAHQLFGPGPEAEAIAVSASKKIVESFRARNGEINCLELTDCDWKNKAKTVIYLAKGGTIKCFKMAAKLPPVAYRDINDALSEKKIEPPPSPVSCAAVLARKMGASDLQAAMAAGWAGGIGLSGGGCGALAAAIWMIGINALNRGEAKIKFNDPRTGDAIDRFLKSSDYEFECSAIVGRRFESVDDHADYLRAGGCAKILEALGS
jgi:hypothetical protein